VYIISVAGLRVGSTKKAYYAPSGTAEASDTNLQYFYRQNRVKNGTTIAPHFNIEFGEKLNLPAPATTSTSATTVADPADYCIEKFTRIIGGSESGAIITGYSIAEEVIGVADGAVYLRDENDSIIRLLACPGLGQWSVDADENGDPLIYAVGSNPTVFGPLLFYFTGDTLYCKNMSTVSEGMFDSRQEELNDLPVAVVTTGITAHKVAVHTDPSGRITVFYLSKSGYVTASISNNSGDTWEYLNNW
jgi:hypothetical protein